MKPTGLVPECAEKLPEHRMAVRGRFKKIPVTLQKDWMFPDDMQPGKCDPLHCRIGREQYTVAGLAERSVLLFVHQSAS